VDTTLQVMALGVARWLLVPTKAAPPRSAAFNVSLSGWWTPAPLGTASTFSGWC
jgi:hypothetical protein